MRRFVLLLVALLLVGCSRPAPAPLPESPPLTPASSGITFQLRIDEAVPGGELWLDTNHVPPEALHDWRVGLTDSQGKAHLLGWLTEAANYKLPPDAAPGEGEVWISTGESAESPGTVTAKIKLQVVYDRYESQALGLSFDVPAGWRLKEQADSISLERTPQGDSSHVESILIRSCANEACGTPEGTLIDESERWIVNRWIPVRRMQRTAKDGTATWTEEHLTFPRADLVFAYSPDVTYEVGKLVESLAASLRFVGESAPEQPPTACEALLAEVHLALGLDWTPQEGFGDCSRSWLQPETWARVTLAEIRFPPYHLLVEPRQVTIQGATATYTAMLARMLPHSMGAPPPPGPKSWVLLLRGGRGHVEIFCSLPTDRSQSDLAAQQAREDQFCLPLLMATKIDNLGKPVAPEW